MNRIPSKTLGGTLELPGTTITGVTNITDTTTSGSPTTGALTVSGGVGIAGNLNVAGGITGGSISYSSTTTGSLSVTNTTQSTNTTTGAMTVAGGVGIAKNLNIGGETNLNALLQVGSPGSKEYLINLGRAGGDTFRNAYIYGSPTGEMRIWNVDPTDNMLFGTNTTEKMRITGGGNVGIGTTTPSTKLDVNGGISCTSLTISGSTPLTFSAASYNPTLDIAPATPFFYTFTNTVSSGQYVKIGKMVVFNFETSRQINFSGGPYGGVISIDLPFVLSKTVDNIGMCTALMASSPLTSATILEPVQMEAFQGTSVVYLYRAVSTFNGGPIAPTAFSYTNSYYISARGCITYFTT